MGNGEVVGEIIFVVRLLLIPASLVLLLIVITFPFWIGPVGGSLGLWNWKIRPQWIAELKATLSLISSCTEISAQSRRLVERANVALQEATTGQGLKAERRFSEAIKYAVTAVHGCNPEFIKEVYKALGEAGSCHALPQQHNHVA